MSRREAERFEEALQRAEQGEAVEERLLPLLQTAQHATILAEPPPPPPNQLALGRQRFLTEAAQLRAAKIEKEVARSPTFLRLAAALMALVLAFGLVSVAGRAVADSLPGEPFYGYKLAVEDARLALTADPQARADLSLALAEARLDEVMVLLERGQPVTGLASDRVDRQLVGALEAARQVEDGAAAQTLERLEMALAQRQRAMVSLAAGLEEPQQVSLQRIVRVMERVRQEAHGGQGDPDGLRERQRHGAPPNPSASPVFSPTPESWPSPVRSRARPTERPAGAPGPGPAPTGDLGGQNPTAPPGHGPDPSPEATDSRPGKSTGEPGPAHPTDQPRAPSPTKLPGPGSKPTAAGPDPTGQPALGPQPTDEPGGPEPTGQPGGGSGDGPSPTEGTGDGSGSGGRGKP